MSFAMLRTSLNRWMPLAAMVSLAALGLLLGTTALAGGPDPFGGDVNYRSMFEEGDTLGFLNPRVIVWILAQLHLLFAAFVLAVPMFVLVMEVIGYRSKDPAKKKQYDGLAYEFARLLTTAFSITSILGAIAVGVAAINVMGGFLVTERMLRMFRKE